MLRYYLCLMALSFNVMFGVTSVPGTLDTSFGRSGNPPGTVTTQIGIYNSVATDVKIQADQKIVVAGYQEIDAIGNREFTLARYTTTGSLDSTFGIGGVVRTRIGDDSVINAIAIQTDGKIVAAGFALENGIYKFALARYTNGGTLDEAFGINGIRTTLIGAISESNWVIIQSDGKIVAAGVADEGGIPKFALARYNSDGTLDAMNFGTAGNPQGTVTTQIGTYADIYSIVIQPDNKILAAGVADEGGISKFALARYNSDGTLDAMNFGTAGNPQGTVITQISTSAGIYSIALQDDGKIVAAGYTNAPSFRFALARYNQDGTLDGATFGTTGNPQGTVITQIGALSQSFAVLVQGTKIVAVGYTITSGIHKFAIARYTDNGSLDAIFNPAGTPQGINTTLINNFARSSAVALQQDGKIVLAGRSKDTAGNDIFALARYYGLAVTIPGAPSNLYGYQQGERYISQLDLVNYLYWRAATDTASYRIYSNDELVGTTSTTQFALHDIVPLKKTTYYVTSVDAVGEEGLSATITLG